MIYLSTIFLLLIYYFKKSFINVFKFYNFVQIIIIINHSLPNDITLFITYYDSNKVQVFYVFLSLTLLVLHIMFKSYNFILGFKTNQNNFPFFNLINNFLGKITKHSY